MIRISKRTEYALIALTAMAKKEQGGLVTARILSEKYHIPPEILNKVLQCLAKHKIIISQQGINGGYRLNKSLSAITLYTLMNAVEGPLALVECTVQDKENCELQASCTIKQPMKIIQEELKRFFNDITLETLSCSYNQSANLKIIEASNG